MNAKMTMLHIAPILVLLFAIVSCESDDSIAEINLGNTLKLSEVIANRTIETGAVIA